MTISQGDDLQRDKKIAFSFYRKLDTDYRPEDLLFIDTLLHSDAAKPPKYPKNGLF
jgi:hypothetical protein